jgi:MtN3 and saliva related transmembrane protein
MLADRTYGRLVARYVLVLAAGVALWAIYGFLKADPVIISANVISFALLMGILYFKMREVMSKSRHSGGRKLCK